MKIKKYFYNLFTVIGIINRDSKKYLLINAILVLAGATLTSYNTWVLKEIIDKIPRYTNKAIIYLGIYYIINISADIFEGIEGYIQTKVSYFINEELNIKINNKISRIKLNIFDDEKFFDLLERLNDNIGVGALNFVKSSIEIIRGLVSIIVYIVILYSVKWYFPIVFVLTSVPYYLIALRESKECYIQEKKLNRQKRLLNYTEGVVFDRIYVKEIHIFNLYDFLVSKAELLRDKILKNKILLLNRQMKRKVYINLLRNISLIGCLSVTYINIRHGDGQLGDFMAVYLAIKSLVTDIFSFIVEIKGVNTYDLYLDDLNFFYSYQEDKNCEAEINVVDIKFENVWFRYDNAKNYALRNISLSIPLGKKIALVGANGSGKSTFISLLLGMYDPTIGNIMIGNERLINVKEELYQQSGVMLQNYNKYQTSVIDNISLGKLELDRVQNVIENKLFDFIKRLPEGIDTKLGQLEAGGCELSGGEWQRLALARALACEGSILIMDEPTASLDPVTESEIYEQFENLSNGKTTILVTHRLSAAKLCDEIFYFENGEIVERGSHDELCQSKGKYYRMYIEQEELYQN